MLRPGTHHIRFLVDGQWRVADDLPAAVDDQGSLANYVAVPIPVVSTPAPALPPSITREKLVPGQSFWSADSSADGEYQQHSQQQQQQQTHAHTTHSQSTHWTNILPSELIEAAREEEAYLSASEGQYEANTRVTTGFVPTPNIPPAPGLPRHLEKLILNTRVGVGLSGAGGVGSGAGVGIRSRSGQVVGGVGSMGVGSGQGQAARKQRRDREREGDRERRDGDKIERDRERGERAMRKRATAAAASAVPNIPPAPPPSEDGTHNPETTGGESLDLNPSSTMTPSSTSAPCISTNANTITTSPQTSLPSTPVAPMSPIPKEPKACGDSGENGTGPEASPTRSPTTLHGNMPASASATGSATNSATTSPNPSSTTPAVTPPSIALIPPPHFSPTSSYPTPSGSRTITIDTSNMPALSDDGSVLPVPSHVVLHHLSTSAIRNGVLAVGNTIRYRKKVSWFSF